MSRATGTRLLGGLVRALGRDGSVLCFHGLREDHDEVDSVMNLTLGAFEAAMDLVRASAEIVPLEDLHRRWSQGRSTRGLVAITFDDAYASLLETAHRWYVPAPFPVTVFVVTGASARGESFWWDRLEALSALLSESDRLRLEAACGMPVNLQGRVDPVFGPLRGLRQWVLGEHRGRAPLGLESELSRLEEGYGRRTGQRAMRVEELHQLARLGPVSYGVHTMTHPVLSLLPAGEVEKEIRGAWNSMQAWSLPNSLPMLAIPFGLTSGQVCISSMESGMVGVFGLNDSTLRWGAADPTSILAQRLSMVQRTTPIRLAYRMGGLREILTHRGLSANQLETGVS